MGITVDELLEERFLNRNLEDQLRIMSEGKPTPKLSLSGIHINEECIATTVYFEASLYNKIPWLTGSEISRSLFCWPCLLFTSHGMWSKAGISDILRLQELVYEHEQTTEHAEAVLNFHRFIKTNSINNITLKPNLNIGKHGNKKHREFLKRLTDFACNIVAMMKEKGPREGSCNRINIKDCMAHLEFLKAYDTHQVHHFDDIICFLKKEPRHLSTLIDAISSVVKQRIKEEVQKSEYISFIITEHLFGSQKNHISTIFRYSKESKVCEKFVDFTKFPPPKSTYNIFQYVTGLISELDIQDRWIAHAFDGGVLPTNELRDLLSKLNAINERALLVSYHGHDFISVLHQSFSHLRDSALFFQTINLISDYLVENPRRWKTFESYMGQTVPSLKDTNWYESTQLIHLLLKRRRYFIKCLDKVVANSKDWAPDDITKAFAFSNYLQEDKTTFFLHLFNHLLTKNAFDVEFKFGTCEPLFDGTLLEMYRNRLREEKNTGYRVQWLNVSKEAANHPKHETEDVKTQFESPETLAYYSELYNNVVNHMIQELELRFADLSRLSFCALLRQGGLKDFVQAMNSIKALMKFQGSNFNEDELMNEITALHSNKIFSDKTPYELFLFLHETNLKSSFKNFYKYLKLILVMPFGPLPPDDDCTSKLKEVKKWFCISEDNEDASGDCSLLLIEFDTLQELKRSDYFYNDVADKFFELSKSVNFSVL